MIQVLPGFSIADSELELTYVRSSGPGGQNVNKVNSKAVLRWNAVSSTSIPPHLRARVLSKLRLTTEGDLMLTSDKFRDQGRNRDDCLEKLREILLEATHVPKIRKKSKPSRSRVAKDKQQKSLHSQKKRMRARPFD